MIFTVQVSEGSIESLSETQIFQLSSTPDSELTVREREEEVQRISLAGITQMSKQENVRIIDYATSPVKFQSARFRKAGGEVDCI